MNKINFLSKDGIIDKIFYIQKKSWIITIVIFLTVFSFAIIIWQNCILSPQPSQSALDNILKIEQEYGIKMDKIKSNHQILKDQIYRFDNPERSSGEREYFETWEDINSKDNIDYVPDNKGYNPEIVF